MDWGAAATPTPIPDVDFGTFWPKISGQKFRDLYRIPAELSNAIVTEQLRLAGMAVIRQLTKWRRLQTAASLAEIPQETVDGIGALVLYWERAVFCEAKAEILRETMTVDRRKEAENTAKSGEVTEDKYREFAADMIAAIQGDNRIYVELI
jgi:nicotinamide mononucleotide adenylyltransferase